MAHERLNSRIAGIAFEPKQRAKWLLTRGIKGWVVASIYAGHNAIAGGGHVRAQTGNLRSGYPTRNNAAWIDAVDGGRAIVNGTWVSSGIGIYESRQIHPII